MTHQIEMSKTDLKKLKKEYTSGSSLAVLSEDWGVGLQTVRRLLIEAGATIRGRGRPVKG